MSKASKKKDQQKVEREEEKIDTLAEQKQEDREESIKQSEVKQEDKVLDALEEKTNVECVCPALVYFHKLSPEEKQKVLLRLGKGEVVIQGPDSLVIEAKK